MDSTTPMAGRRNNMMAPTSCRPLFKWCVSSSWPCSDVAGWKPTARYVHIEADTISMIADLLTPTWSSSTTKIKPTKNSIVIKCGLMLSLSTILVGKSNKAIKKMMDMKVTPMTFSVRLHANTAAGTHERGRAAFSLSLSSGAGMFSASAYGRNWGCRHEDPRGASLPRAHELSSAPASAARPPLLGVWTASQASASKVMAMCSRREA
mmetsp:Transcript_88462/g.270785  ORF Transcript_88462/g.270785 Transcript_88462/m.270785 type:complete len:208 (-) Transcript_88462:60-683(-)